jgi:hypothetical protein
MEYNKILKALAVLLMFLLPQLSPTRCYKQIVLNERIYHYN